MSKLSNATGYIPEKGLERTTWNPSPAGCGATMRGILMYMCCCFDGKGREGGLQNFRGIRAKLMIELELTPHLVCGHCGFVATLN